MIFVYTSVCDIFFYIEPFFHISALHVLVIGVGL